MSYEKKSVIACYCMCFNLFHMVKFGDEYLKKNYKRNREAVIRPVWDPNM